MLKNRKPPKLYSLLVSLTALLCLSVSAQALTPSDTGPGTLTYALAAPDGTNVVLQGVCVMPRAADDTSGFYVREPWEPIGTARLIRVQSLAPVAIWQTLDVTGQVWTIDSIRVISPASVYAWTDRNGRILPAPMPDTFDWPWKLLYNDTTSNTVSAQDTIIPPPPSGDPGTPVSDPPVEGTIAWALQQPAGTDITLYNQEVCTADSIRSGDTLNTVYDYADCFYLEEPNRSAGIRVNWTPTVQIGTIRRGDVIGLLQGTVVVQDGEKQINATDFYVVSSGEVSPLGMNNRAIGGNDLPPDTPGVYQPYGLYNKGLLIRTWGRVTYADPGGTFCYIDDGSALQDGSGHTGVRILLTSSGPGWQSDDPVPQVGQYIAVTGISTTATVNNQPVRAVRQRNDFGRTVSTLSLPHVTNPGRGLMTTDDGTIYYTVEFDYGMWEYRPDGTTARNDLTHALGCLDLDTDNTTCWAGSYGYETGNLHQYCWVYRYAVNTFALLQTDDLSSWLPAANPTYGGNLDGLTIADDGTMWISSDLGTRIHHINRDGTRLAADDFETPWPIAGQEYVNGCLWLVAVLDENTELMQITKTNLHGTVLAWFLHGQSIEDLDWRQTDKQHLRGISLGGTVYTWNIAEPEILQ